MSQFDHERLEVYRAAIEFVVLAHRIIEQLPRGRGNLADQLQRASTSIPFNIAEGAGEFSWKDKARFYRMAKRSATESAAIVDVCNELKILKIDQFSKARQLLIRIVSMLIKLVKSLSESGTGTGTGTGTSEEPYSIEVPNDAR